MLRYFTKARATLASDGMLFLDVYGGTEALQPLTIRRRYQGFTYVWEQRSFDPISCWGENFIHYEFPDGSALRRAFRYFHDSPFPADLENTQKLYWTLLSL